MPHDWREPRFQTDRDGDADVACPVCGERSAHVYRCSECGADLCADYGGAGHDLAPARDKPARFLDVSLDRGDHIDGLEGMPPRQKLQQRIRGLRSVAAVQRYIEAELALDRPEAPRQEVIGALNRRKAALESDEQAAASGAASDASGDVAQAMAATDGGVQTASAAATDCEHPDEQVSIETFAGDRGRWCARCCSFLEVFE